MLKVAEKSLQGDDVKYIQDSYKDLENILGDEKVDAILLDL